MKKAFFKVVTDLRLMVMCIVLSQVIAIASVML